MKAVELIAEVDDHHRLRGTVPSDFRPGRVRVIVIVPDEDEAGAAWEQGVAREWAAELADIREDIYTLEDGEPENAGG
jgi:hypothetical protein